MVGLGLDGFWAKRQIFGEDGKFASSKVNKIFILLTWFFKFIAALSGDFFVVDLEIRFLHYDEPRPPPSLSV